MIVERKVLNRVKLRLELGVFKLQSQVDAINNEIEQLLAQPEQKQEIPYGVGKLLEFAGKNIRSPIKSERAPPHLYLTRKDCIEVGNYLKELGL